MYTQSYLRYLLGDGESLRLYYDYRQPVQLDDIKRNLMLMERKNNYRIPDHYYRLGQKKSFDGIEYIGQLFTIGLRNLADEYLEIRSGVIYVKAERMNSWQLMLPYMPPLLLDCIKLWTKYVLMDGKEQEYIYHHFRSNIAFTTYPSPYIPQLKDYEHRGGFSDLHMHLNGVLETDLVWQDFLHTPNEIKKELDKAYAQEKVKEQYIQSDVLNTPDRLYELFKIASVLRYLLFCYAYDRELPGGIDQCSFADLLDKVAQGNILNGFYASHPMELMLGKMEYHFLEGILYIKLLQLMSQHPENDTVSRLFHYYLLILGQTNKMLVHQPTNYGFEEFQKITMNGLREYSESQNYLCRFTQLCGNQLRYLKLLEGRFSPKDDQHKNVRLIENILTGWSQLRKLQREQQCPESELRLIAHFIKRSEGKRDDQIRYKRFREDIGHRADLLLQLLRDSTRLSEHIIGIDAAASEFDTPPEVFSQVYRQLREAGFQHFTYHAGEDFYHILSGLRSIYEAITYLDLQRGDRIGHATAAGVPVALWHRNVGNKILIRQGEHLDNLIFAYHLISKKGSADLKSFLPMLSLRIDELGSEIYREYNPASLQVAAWEMRKENPQAILNDPRKNSDPEAALYIRYHCKDVADRYDEIIEVDTEDILGEAQLTDLQLLLLEEMHKRGIVIETLPTSNVLIGNHHDFSTYHLFAWYQWKKQGNSLPPIVIGTDDAGVFATNIYNEYCHIFCQFVYGKGMNVDEVMSFIRELDENARFYAF